MNLIKFDEVEFSERRSEEVISFYWRSGYFGLFRTCVCVYVCVTPNVWRHSIQLLLRPRSSIMAH